jgi:hypothetical protein
MMFEAELRAWREYLELAAMRLRAGVDLSDEAREALAKMLESLAVETDGYAVPDGTVVLARELTK